MKQNKLGDLFGNLLSFGKENSAPLLAGLALAGVGLTGVLAWKAGRKADRVLVKYHEEQEKLLSADLVAEELVEAQKELKMECVKEMTPIVIGPVIMGLATGAAVIGSQSINARKIATITAAYNLANESVKDMNGKMRDLLGEKKTREIKDAIVGDKVKDTKRPAEKDVIVTGKGNTLCMDLYTGKAFRTDVEHLRQAISELTDQCRDEMYVAINDLYSLIGGIQLNDAFNDLGWSVDDISHGRLPIELSSQLVDDEPAIVLVYDVVRQLRKY